APPAATRAPRTPRSCGCACVPPAPPPSPTPRGRPPRRNNEFVPAVGQSYDLPDRPELAGEVPRSGGAGAAVSADGLVAGERHPLDHQRPEVEEGTAKAARAAAAAARCSTAGAVATTRQAIVQSQVAQG